MQHLLARQYELTTLIGRGPTGAVWRARERSTRESVAVKVLDSRLSDDPDTVDRFVREQPILKAFLHPAYVRVRDLIAAEGVVALVMELVTGWDVRRHIDQSGPFEPAMAVGLAITVAEALAAAHDAGVVHCDLKPSNVLLEEPAGEARLTDCRVARLARGYQGPAAWYVSAEYATPEVIRGGPPVAATDVYALGLLLCEMLTSTTPYRGADDDVLAAHLRAEPDIPAMVPPRLRRLLADCLQGEPAARPTAWQVAELLRSAEIWGSVTRESGWSRGTPSDPSPPIPRPTAPVEPPPAEPAAQADPYTQPE